MVIIGLSLRQYCDSVLSVNFLVNRNKKKYHLWFLEANMPTLALLVAVCEIADEVEVYQTRVRLLSTIFELFLG